VPQPPQAPRLRLDPPDGDLKGRARPESPTASPGTEPNRRVSDPDPSTGASKGPPVLPIPAPASPDILNRYRHGVLVTLATADGQVAQRSTLTGGHKTILTALGLGEPARFFDFTVPTD